MIFSLFLSFIFIYPSFYPAVGMSVLYGNTIHLYNGNT
ncbi:hypothetical protein HMPREF9137_1450 [Prevotella denticola F0289]|nr:hypothetical protein HMPREF9137_1450 [Prevotella denticola F0289]